MNNEIIKVSSTSVYSLVTDETSILTNDSLENIYSILVSSLETDTVTILVND